MPEISTMKSSRFLKKEDCGAGMLLTIRTCEQMNVARQGEPDEMKWCLTFEEEDKPYVTNATTREVISSFSGRTNSDNWAGVKVVLYNDPSVFYNGKAGAIRVRAPRIPSQSRPVPPVAAPAPAPVAPPVSPGGPDEDVPF